MVNCIVSNFNYYINYFEHCNLYFKNKYGKVINNRIGGLGMKEKSLSEENKDNVEESKVNKKIRLFKDTKWVSFGTYIMTVECFCSSKGVASYVPFINKVVYEETNMIKASYNNESYYIENKELCKNVSIGDRIVVTIKYSYDKDDNLIHTNVHHSHPYPLSYN